jgi:hypothetical protein
VQAEALPVQRQRAAVMRGGLCSWCWSLDSCWFVLLCCCAAALADQRAFVITLTRAGEDNARFQLTDTESTFASFAGADYDLQVRHNPGSGKRLSSVVFCVLWGH